MLYIRQFNINYTHVRCCAARVCVAVAAAATAALAALAVVYNFWFSIENRQCSFALVWMLVCWLRIACWPGCNIPNYLFPISLSRKICVSFCIFQFIRLAWQNVCLSGAQTDCACIHIALFDVYVCNVCVCVCVVCLMLDLYRFTYARHEGWCTNLIATNSSAMCTLIYMVSKTSSIVIHMSMACMRS